MDQLLNRIAELEGRTRRVERHLFAWRALALVAIVGAGVLLFNGPGNAQLVGIAGAPATFSAPFVVKGASGTTIFEVKEFVDRDRGNAVDALLTFYRSGQPAAMIRTTGLSYKDVYDKDANYLNVLETWLYRYQDEQGRKITPTPYLATSTGLTRAGGSLVIFNAQGAQSMTPPFAARITAKRGVGGEVILYNPDGTEAKSLQPK